MTIKSKYVALKNYIPLGLPKEIDFEIKSRALEIKIILSENDRIRIINELIKLHNVETILDLQQSNLTPGNFLKFNYLN